MKKLLAFLFALIATASLAASTPGVGDVKASQMTGVSPPSYADRFIKNQTLSLWGFDASTPVPQPADVAIGSGLQMSVIDGVLTISANPSAIAWGSITGTLSNQTDLAAALALLVPKTTTVNGQALSGNVVVTTITGNAGTATALQTARTINGVSFDGTSNITVAAAASTLTGTALASNVVSSSLTSAAGGAFGTAAYTAATAYAPATSSTSLLYGDGAGGTLGATIGTGISFTGGTLSATGTGGTVTSVGMTVPGFLSVTPSTITGSGIFAVTLATQTANTIFAGPSSGSAATPSFRALTVADEVAGGSTTQLQYNNSGVLAGSSGLTWNGSTLAASAVSASTYNGLTVTALSSGFSIAGGTSSKTLTMSNTLTFTGTDTSSVNFGAGGTVLYSGGSYVASIAGTANQITASASTGAVTLSLPTAITGVNSITAQTSTALTLNSAVIASGGNSLTFAGLSSITDSSSGAQTFNALTGKTFAWTINSAAVATLAGTSPNLTLDAGTGTATSTLTLVGRSSGAAATATIVATAGGSLTIQPGANANIFFDENTTVVLQYTGGTNTWGSNFPWSITSSMMARNFSTGTTAYSVAAWGAAGSVFDAQAVTVTDSSTAGGGTAALETFYAFNIPTLAATNTSVTTTTAATLYIAGAPTAGSNQTITNPYALEVAAGNSIFAATTVSSGPGSGTVVVNGGEGVAGSLFLGQVLNAGVTAYSYGAPQNLGASAIIVPAKTYTFTGTTGVTSFGSVTLNQPTYTNSSVNTVTNLATLLIAAAPAVAGSQVGTNLYAIDVAAGNSIFNGAVTVAGSSNLTVSGGTILTPRILEQTSLSAAAWGGTGIQLGVGNGNTFTDTSTAASGTAALETFVSIAAPTLAATNATVTTTTAAALYVAGPPSAGSNQTITNPYALEVATGRSYFGGGLLGNGSTAASFTANGQWQINGGSTTGGVISGQGSTSDVVIQNASAATALSIPHGTTNVVVAGTLSTTGAVLASTAPTNGVGTWGLGTIRTTTGLVPSTTNSLEITVAGTRYDIILATTTP